MALSWLLIVPRLSVFRSRHGVGGALFLPDAVLEIGTHPHPLPCLHHLPSERRRATVGVAVDAYANGTNICLDGKGEPVWVHGRVTDAKGKPIAGAKLDIWQTAPNGLYSSQDPDQDKYSFHGVITVGVALNPVWAICESGTIAPVTLLT